MFGSGSQGALTGAVDALAVRTFPKLRAPVPWRVKSVANSMPGRYLEIAVVVAICGLNG
jgi:hypothetical protein